MKRSRSTAWYLRIRAPLSQVKLPVFCVLLPSLFLSSNWQLSFFVFMQEATKGRWEALQLLDHRPFSNLQMT